VLFIIVEMARLSPRIDLAKLPLKTSLLLMAAMIGVSLGLATLSYRSIEVTGRRWLRERFDVGRGPGIAEGDGLPSRSCA
jgi:peptidoglycan/LPS O-acetylase OafA/YrhL